MIKLNESIAVGQTTLTREFAGMTVPCSIQLTSSDVSRKIELSLDGINFFQQTYDVSNASYLIITLLAPIGYVKITGVAGDKLIICED
jgi:hypothetical protein